MRRGGDPVAPGLQPHLVAGAEPFSRAGIERVARGEHGAAALLQLGA
jgi:hypothetical protein